MSSRTSWANGRCDKLIVAGEGKFRGHLCARLASGSPPLVGGKAQISLHAFATSRMCCSDFAGPFIPSSVARGFAAWKRGFLTKVEGRETRHCALKRGAALPFNRHLACPPRCCGLGCQLPATPPTISVHAGSSPFPWSVTSWEPQCESPRVAGGSALRVSHQPSAGRMPRHTPPSPVLLTAGPM